MTKIVLAPPKGHTLTPPQIKLWGLLAHRCPLPAGTTVADLMAMVTYLSDNHVFMLGPPLPWRTPTEHKIDGEPDFIELKMALTVGAYARNLADNAGISATEASWLVSTRDVIDQLVEKLLYARRGLAPIAPGKASIPTRCQAVSPDKKSQCGLEKGHIGNHTALVPVPWPTEGT